MKRLLIVIFILWSTTLWAAPKVIVTHALTKRGEPKYKEGFTHLDYVNPNAPKGGTISFAATGTYDNFNRYAQRGNAAAGSESLYDSLVTNVLDEYDVYYGLIAEKFEYPDNFEWMIFHINPKARFQDGVPITAEDVRFSFYKFVEQGVPQFKKSFEDVKEVIVLDNLRVKVVLKKSNKDKLISFANLSILPKHYWAEKDFSEPLTEVPLGSSAFTISDYKIGQYVVVKRLKDYWAKDLPVNKGRYNFDFERYDYYKDETVKLEAFKAGEFDFRSEADPKLWATSYKGPNFDKGYIKKDEVTFDWPQNMTMYVFNTERPFFQNIKVREAITYAMDFEWMNKNLLYGLYQRTRSFFENTDYAAYGLPSNEELAILNPLKGKIPDRVFTEEYNPPKTNGSGKIRKNIRKALKLFKEAGWEIKNKVLTNVKSGELFEFEIINYRPSSERYIIPIQKNLQRMGIKMNIRTIDVSQFTNRMRSRDYDMILSRFSTYFYPTSSMKFYWQSKYIDSTYNSTGVKDPVIDELVQKIIDNQYNPEKLKNYGLALDRVLQWNFFGIPRWHNNKFWMAYWDKFSFPPTIPKYGLPLNSWWMDSEKEKKLPKRNAPK